MWIYQTLKMPHGCNFQHYLGTAVNQCPMTIRMSQGKMCCVFHGTSPSGHDPSTVVSYLLLIWTRHSNTFSRLFSSVSTNLWYGSVEREKIIGDALLNLTTGLFPDISSVCVLLWTMPAERNGWMEVRITNYLKVVDMEVTFWDISGLNTCAPLCTLKTKFFHIHRDFFHTPNDIQWHFHLLNYVRLNYEQATSVGRHFRQPAAAVVSNISPFQISVGSLL